MKSGRTISRPVASGEVDWDHIGISSNPDRPRLGKERKRVETLPITEYQENFHADVSEPEIAWRFAVTLCNFDPEELQFFEVCRLGGHPWRRAGEVLGWDLARVERVRKRVDRAVQEAKIALRTSEKQSGGSSARPFFRERTTSGALIWSLKTLDSQFVSAIAAERKYFFSATRPQTQILSHSSVKGIYVMKQTQLEGELRTLRVKFDTLVVSAQSVDDDVRRLDGEAEKIRREIAKDSEDILLLEGHKPNPSLPKKLASAGTALEEAMARAKAYAGAIQRQSEAIAAIEERIYQGKNAALMADLAGPKAEFLAAVEALMRASVKVGSVFDKHGAADRLGVTGYVIDLHNPADPIERYLDRQITAQMLGLGITMHSARMVRGYAEKIA